MEYQEIKTLKARVEYCLQEYPESRNSDIHLTIHVWQVFYAEYLRDTSGGFGLDSIYLANLFKIPSQDNIKRIRAMFQNKKRKY